MGFVFRHVGEYIGRRDFYEKLISSNIEGEVNVSVSFCEHHDEVLSDALRR